jgi:acyl-CoA synthetase (AMP-forming)/AMP-acid ligase II
MSFCIAVEGVHDVTDEQVASRWIIADVWEMIAALRPQADCIVQGSRRISWAEFDRRADALGAYLLEAGLGHQAKVALFVHNGPAFLIGAFACLKVGMVPVNTNFRYLAEEAAALWEDCDAECVIFSAALSATVAQARQATAAVRRWLWVDDATADCPEWAQPFDAPPTVPGPVRAPWPRDPDDLILLYTGGTTGRPKGVMWRQDDVFAILNSTAAVRYDAETGTQGVRLTQQADTRSRPRFVPCGPLIHGTAGFSSYGVLNTGGAVILLQERSFNVGELLGTVEEERVSHISVVGDAHARPIAERLDAEPARWDLSSLRLLTSAGMQLSEDARSRLLAHCPRLLCVDVLGSSEAPAVGRARSVAGSLAASGSFAPQPGVRVLDETGAPVNRGSGRIGTLAVKGRHPLGYYKDPARSAATFRIIDGQRWSITGDLAKVEADGSIRLLGRGALVVNTGGEKVYVREVEDALIKDQCVADAAVVGMPDDRLGQLVVAAVQPYPGATISAEQLIGRLRAELAPYKVPRRLHILDSLGRDESGKIDYETLRRRLGELGDPA